MKIIRWILSHSFLILVIVAVIYGYMFWGNLAGKDTPAGKAIAYLSDEFVAVDEFVNAIKAKQARRDEKDAGKQAGTDAVAEAPVAEAPVMEEVQSIDEPQAPAVSSHADDEPVADSGVVAEARVLESEQESNQESKQADTGAEDNTASPADTPANTVALTNSQGNTADMQAQSSPAETAISEEAKGSYVSAEIEKQLNNVDGQGNKLESAPASVIRESWIAARKSYYQRDYALSIKSYQQVIDNTEDNFDAYGELGNVYFNQGKNTEAASAYFEAAAILVRKGQVHRARSLIGLLRHLDKTKANELQQLIDTTLS